MTIVGAPLDLGQGRRGVDMGPSAIRYAGLEERLSSFGCQVVDRGNVTTPEPEALAVRDERARFLPEILEACSRLGAIVAEVVTDGAVPLVLGGDHSVALGTLAGLRAAAGEPGGVIWIDAHGDLNTPDSSPSGNVHGMPLAAALGAAGDRFAHSGLSLPAVDVDRVVLVGVRSLDPAERTRNRERGIRAITMTEIDRIGIEAAMREAIDRASGPGFVHVSLDLDALDPEASSGSMRTATSTRRRPVLRATSTACRSPRRWVSPATTSPTKNWRCLRSIPPACAWSACGRWTRPSAC